MSRPVIVDVTSDETADLLHTALGQGFDVVLANKKPLTHSWAGYERLMSACRPGGPRLKYESDGRRGPPDHRHLPEADRDGRRVLKIEGCVSGTLMHIASAVSAGPSVLRSGTRSGRARLRRTGSARRFVGRRRRKKGADPGAPARLPRTRPEAGQPGAAIAEGSVLRHSS